jgi:hypothetical protein
MELSTLATDHLEIKRWPAMAAQFDVDILIIF